MYLSFFACKMARLRKYILKNMAVSVGNAGHFF